MNANVDALRKGAVAGIIATGAMSAVMLAGQRWGRVGTLPPKKIVAATVEAVARQRPSEDAVKPLAVAAHFGYGAAGGSLYTLLVGTDAPGWAALKGALFGCLIWAVSYEGWVPAMGIMPPARRDRPDRVYTMILAHVVYGSVLGLCSSRRERSVKSSIPG